MAPAGWRLLLLGAWLALAGACLAEQPARSPARGDGSAAAAAPIRHVAMKRSREAEIEAFLRHYFQSWSERKFDEYGDCFLPRACIQMLDLRDRLATFPRDLFVAQQREMMTRSPERAVEIPLKIDVRAEGRVVRAVVLWKLTTGTNVEYGYDHFTLARSGDEWKIANLLFYEIDPSEINKQDD